MVASDKDRAWIELNSVNLRHNVQVLRQLLPQRCQLMPAVKANAYGHGAVLITKELNSLGVNAFCVASIEEGIELRKNNISGEILIMGYTHPDDFRLLKQFYLTQTVLDKDYAIELNSYGEQIHVHIGIDTGMNRLGLNCKNIDEITKIFCYKNLVVDGMYTHLCVSDTIEEPYIDYTKKQIDSFYKVVKQIEAKGFNCPKVHIQSSYGLLNYPDVNCDYVRVGIALYGLLSTKKDTDNCVIDLLPVLSVKARISTVKKLNKGESVGYGMSFTAPKDMTIAVISIGYADGIPRSLSCGIGNVIVDGTKVPIIGRICMDQMFANVSNIPKVRANDIAVIIGKNKNANISATDIAEQTGTISNEILSRLGSRLSHIII